MLQDNINQHGVSVDAPTKITYSAQELAELYLTIREDFFGLDLEKVTNEWNLNYIYDFLYNVRNVDLFDDIIEWFAECWKSKHQYYISFDKVSDNDLELNYNHFKAQLQFIKNKLLERFESERHTEELRMRMLSGYNHNSTNTQAQKKAQPVVKSTTAPPVFSTSSDPNYDYSVEIASLPESIQKIIMVSQKVFDVYVKQLNEDIWLTVVKDKTKLCGCLFFLSNFHYITARNTKPEEFNELLHCVIKALKGKGSVTSSIRRRTETIESNIERSYKCYACADVSKSMEEEIFKLRNDCKLLLDGFTPVLVAMEAEELAAKEARNQSVSASSAA